MDVVFLMMFSWTILLHLGFEDAIMDPFTLMRNYCSSLYRRVLAGQVIPSRIIPAGAFAEERQSRFQGTSTMKATLVPLGFRNWQFKVYGGLRSHFKVINSKLISLFRIHNSQHSYQLQSRKLLLITQNLIRSKSFPS